MNDLNLLRHIKFLNKLKEYASDDGGLFASDLASELGWKEIAIRSTAGHLQKTGNVHIIDTSKGWYICHLEDLKNETGSGKNKKVRGKA